MKSELLKARIEDTAQICRRTSSIKYLGFLSSEEAVLAQRSLERQDVKFDFFGGYLGAERVMLGCFPEWTEDFDYPITPITFLYRTVDKLTHRDFLGSLMALGLKREAVGDILTSEGRTVAFVTDEISDYIINQVKKSVERELRCKKGTASLYPVNLSYVSFHKLFLRNVLTVWFQL